MPAADFTQALILSGGGAYGAYEVGVMNALFNGESPATRYTPLSPGIFAGTSVGAINASVIVSNAEDGVCSAVRYLEGIWRTTISSGPGTCGNGIFRFRGDLLRYLDADCLISNPARPFVELGSDGSFFAQDWFKRGIRFLISSGSLENRVLQSLDVSSFVSSAAVAKLLTETVSLETIRRSDLQLRIAGTNWDTGEVTIFENKHMNDEFGYQMILGSAALPGFFRPHYIHGQPYVDGGLLMNTPLNCAILAGAETLHVVYMDPDVQNIPLSKLMSTIETLDRVLVITSATKTNEDIDTAAWINEGLEALERAARGENLSKPEMMAFLRVAAQLERHIREGIPYKKLTIHRYHPHEDLGGGALGLLNFDRARMIDLIERGFLDAMNHDCATSHCILPH